jgi:hypothetical protein
LKVNILRARITPKKWGNMVVELDGDKARISELEGIIGKPTTILII